MRDDKLQPQTTAKLDGDELHLTPEQFVALSQAVFGALVYGSPDEACRVGFRAIGLTEEQIASRKFRATKMVVHYV